MRSLMGANFDPSGIGRQRIEDGPVGGITVPTKTTGDLPRFEKLYRRAEHLSDPVKESDIEVGLRGVFDIQSFQDKALHDQRSIFSLKPDFLDDDHRRIHAIQLDMRHIGRSPERRGTTGQQGTGQAE